MTDRAANHLLSSFDLGAYLAAVRTTGRLDLDLSIRQAAARTHQELIGLTSTSRGELSSTVRRQVDIAIRTLAPENEFDRQLQEGPNEVVVPRYRWYANIDLLNDAVGFTRRRSIGEQLEMSEAALQVVVEDWFEYEQAAADGRASFGTRDTDAGSVAKRLDRLGKLVGHLPTGGSALASSQPPSNFSDLLPPTDDGNCIKHLTALPLTQSHDEYAFLRTIHIGEIVFRTTLLCVWEARALIAIGALDRAADILDAAGRFLAVLRPSFWALRTMETEHFAVGFRSATGEASAQQSLSYQHLETLLKSQNDEHKRAVLAQNAPEVAGVFAYDSQDFLPLAEQVQRIDGDAAGAIRVWDSTNEVLRIFASWRKFHEIHFAKAGYIPLDGPGTGGSSGAPYLTMQTFPSGIAPRPAETRSRPRRRPGPAVSLTSRTSFPMLPVASVDL